MPNIWQDIGHPTGDKSSQEWRDWHALAERYIENMARSGQARSLADLGILNKPEHGAAMYGTQWADPQWWKDQRMYGHNQSWRDVGSGPEAHWQGLPGTDIAFSNPSTGGPGLENFRYISKSDPDKTYNWGEVSQHREALLQAIKTLSQGANPSIDWMFSAGLSPTDSFDKGENPKTPALTGQGWQGGDGGLSPGLQRDLGQFFGQWTGGTTQPTPPDKKPESSPSPPTVKPSDPSISTSGPTNVPGIKPTGTSKPTNPFGNTYDWWR